MSSSAVARLSYLLIYAVPSPEEEQAARDAFTDEDSQEASQVLFYYSTRNVQTRDKMLRHLGLAKGLDNFVSMFDVSPESTLITSIKSSLVTVSPEPGYYIHANVTLDSPNTSNAKPKNSADASGPKDIPVRIVESYLLQTYETFKLLNGPITVLDRLHGRKETERRIEQFWTSSLAKWEFDLEAGTAFHLEKFLGSPLPPLSPHSTSQPSASPPCSLLLSRSQIYHRDHLPSFPPSLIHTLLSYLPPAPRPRPTAPKSKLKSTAYETRKSSSLDWGAKTLMHGIGIHTWGSNTPTETSSTSKHASSSTEDSKETVQRSKHSSSRTSSGGLGGIGAFFLPKDHFSLQQADRRRTQSAATTGAISGSEKGKDGWKWLLGESLGSAIGVGGSTTPSSSSKTAASSPETDEVVESKDHVKQEPKAGRSRTDVDVNEDQDGSVDPRQIPLPGSPRTVESGKEIEIDLLSEAMETDLPVPSVTESSEGVEEEGHVDRMKDAEGEKKQEAEAVEEELIWKDLKVWIDRDASTMERQREDASGEEGERSKESDLKFTIITFPDQTTLPILYAYFPLDPSTPSSSPVPTPTKSFIMQSYQLSRQSPRTHNTMGSISTSLVGLTSDNYGVWRTARSEATGPDDEVGAAVSEPSGSGSATISEKVKRDARERSLVRSLEILRSSEMIQETIARTTLSSSWLVSRTIPSSSSSPDEPSADTETVSVPKRKDIQSKKSDKRGELVGSVEGKGITLGDLDIYLTT